MNTRIQVEHPVTEMVTGIDIIKEQLNIASGLKMKHKQDKVKIKGHAIECRINAEDPENFTPSPGLLKRCYFPGGYGVRVDSAVMSGYVVPAVYDSLIAKIIVWGEDRKDAISRMKRALQEIILDGIKTTVPLHLSILSDADFVEGNINTKFIERFGS